MAYPFDESFATGIPAGFGAGGGAGGVAATWNATDQAVDLAFTQAQNFWTVTAGAQASDFWFEMDLEIVAATYTPPHFGFWLWDGVGSYEGFRIAVIANGWVHSNWTSSGSEYDGSGANASALWAVVGARKTLRLDVRKGTEGDWWDLLLSVDGLPVARLLRRYCSTLLPCIFGYGITLRPHRAAGGAPSTLPATPLLQRRGLGPVVGRRILVPEHAVALAFKHRGLRPLALTRNHYYHGTHRIAGSVKVKGTPDVPVSRRVLLYDERANVVVREAWSDGATGAYSFDLLNPEIRYLVIAYDHKQNYRAVVADHLSAEPGP